MEFFNFKKTQRKMMDSNKFKWGKREWFEYMFDTVNFSDRWGHQWRGSQKFRYEIYLKILKMVLSPKKSINILDIGCGLGDFTTKVWKLNPKNDVLGIDISENAIVKASKKYPNIEFQIASLPELPFNENSFDLILCLEVLYYLSFVDRIESLKNIKRVMKTGGYLLFSGVLDNGVRYFKKDKIINLISKYFKILEIKYNYAKVYTDIEKKLLFLLHKIETVEKLLNLSDKNFLDWYSQRIDKEEVKMMNAIRNFSKKIPFSKKVVIFFKEFLRLGLGQKTLIKICYWLTKLILKQKGQTHIIILTQKE